MQILIGESRGKGPFEPLCLKRVLHQTLTHFRLKNPLAQTSVKEKEILDVRIRRCNADDVDTLRQIASETYDQTFRPMNTAETVDMYLETAFKREILLEELSNPKCDFFFMNTDCRLTGYLKLNEAPAQSDVNDPASLELERIYIKREFQGKGFGKILINYSMEIARKRLKRYLWLGVWEKNANAIAFYGKMGFRVAGHHKFRMGDEAQQDLIMKMDLEY